MTNDYSISILTCGKSDDYLYSLFGHTAVRIKDNLNNIDIVYNYGTFDSSNPWFYFQFINGKLLYFLSSCNYEAFLYTYKYEKRYIHEQVLNLTQEQKKTIYLKIESQLNSNDKFYYYDFIKDNCTTRTIKLLLESTDYNYNSGLITEIQNMNSQKGVSIRNTICHYLPNDSYSMIGVNVLLGLYSDTISSRNVALFLPDTLEYVLDNVYLNDIKLVKDHRIIYEPEDNLSKMEWISTNSILYVVLVIMVIISLNNTYRFTKYKIVYLLNYYIVQSLSILISLIGCLLLIISFFSHIELMRLNLNLLWCNPLYLLLVFNYKRCAISVILLLGISIYSILYYNHIFFISVLPILLIILLLLFNYNILDWYKKKLDCPLSLGY
ncbi:MAG: DUF4105 domain-containing protein [Bacteroidales bacterium]|nr:DUF4105 domain-containing protein [Bacteroidales bacterium]